MYKFTGRVAGFPKADRFGHLAVAVQQMAGLSREQRHARASSFFADTCAVLESGAVAFVTVDGRRVAAAELAQMIRAHALPFTERRALTPGGQHAVPGFAEYTPQVSDPARVAAAIIDAHGKANSRPTGEQPLPDDPIARQFVLADRKRRGEA